MLVSYASHRGLVRKKNEDYLYTDDQKGIFIVADGMGGHRAGNIASYGAVSNIVEQVNNDYSTIIKSGVNNILKCMEKWIKQANTYVYNLANSNEDYSGMGTTLTMALNIDDKILLAHVGDSRGYIIREKDIIQLTKDHSLVQELLNNGTISPMEAENHPQKNLITRALGTEPDIEVDLTEHDFNHQDVLLLCTDGLTNMLSKEDIIYIYQNTDSLDKFVEQLINQSNKNGGYDNITVIAVTSNGCVVKSEVKA